MAFLFGLEKVHLEYPSKEVFRNVSLGVNDGDCIGIVGSNGGGKSSLLGLFAGSVQPDEGRVVRTRGVRFATLSQTDELIDAASVGQNVVGDAPEYEWASNASIRSIIDALIGDVPWDGAVATLSGGQRRRVDLARVLIADADVLLLDEPTNHLDMGVIDWLAQHLKQRFARKAGALLVVTHDRWFLDEVCQRMWEVHDGRVEPFEGGYSAYALQRVERARQAQQAEQKRQNLLRRELAWLSRGARARSSKPKFHVEAARELISSEPPVRNSIELKQAAIARLGKQCVSVENISFAYPNNPPLFSDVTWLIGPGDRFGLLGENGAGKSTLLSIVQGLLKVQKGRVKIGKTVQFAFLSQRLEELEALKNYTVREVLQEYQSHYIVDGKEVSATQLFEQLGFAKSVLFDTVATLSGGQKRRLQLMLILLSGANVLILDEPSNDLDIDMMNAMESVLDSWPGTLVVVSHDRYFIERVTDNQYALIDGVLRHVPRGVEEYLELLNQVSYRGASQSERLSQRAPASPTSPPPNSLPQNATHNAPNAATLSSGEAYQLRKTLASCERKIATLEKKIEQEKQKQLSTDPSDYLALQQAQEAIQELVRAKESLEEEWLELSEQLEHAGA